MFFMRHGYIFSYLNILICQVKTQDLPTLSPSTENAKCYDAAGWHDDDGEKYNCGWYAQPVNGDDDDDYYNEGDTRCILWGSCCVNFGYTAAQACCVCGGGFTEAGGVPSGHPTVSMTPTKSDHPTSSPSLSLQPTEFCRDIPGWHDADGLRGVCEWYAAPVGDDDDYYNEGGTRCNLFGTSYENDGFTASTACCVCGGGYKLGQDPSTAPTSTPKPTSITPAPTNHPTISLQPSSSLQPSEYCQNVIDWHASDSVRYDCDWFELPTGDDDYYIQVSGTRCDLWGDGFENMGHVANTACCVCGGGYRGADIIPTARPSGFSSASPSLKPTILTAPTKTPQLSAAVQSRKPSLQPSNFLFSGSDTTSNSPSNTETKSKNGDLPSLDAVGEDTATPTSSPVFGISDTTDESASYCFSAQSLNSMVMFALSVWFAVQEIVGW